MRAALLARVDGSSEVVDLDAEGRDDALIRDALGCGWLESYVLAPGLHLWCDEEGRLAGKPVNPAGSVLASVVSRGRWVEWLVGPVLFTGGERRGRIQGLSEKQITALRRWIAGSPIPATP